YTPLLDGLMLILEEIGVERNVQP
ncbi:nitrate reductase molybdenum cofactor assembly chaperone, partial [Rhizobium leguminosarum]|nr:nitrate reductase molybdenum cofactor assembly chaperone [Rhizobium ruizarguesonis]